MVEVCLLINSQPTHHFDSIFRALDIIERNKKYIVKNSIIKSYKAELDDEEAVDSITQLESRLLQSQASMKKGKSVIQASEEILHLVDSNLNNTRYSTKEGKHVQEHLEKLKEEVQEALDSKDTVSNLRKTLNSNLESVMETIRDEFGDDRKSSVLDKRVSFSSLPQTIDNGRTSSIKRSSSGFEILGFALFELTNRNTNSCIILQVFLFLLANSNNANEVF